ncbi:MAG: SprT family zinc-dependent metalloprotease [Gammaproteobacteria bacterium]|jgi:predicted metal-dependent hydrolase
MNPAQQLLLPLHDNEFHIRRSQRAKYLRINITSVGQVEVVVPRRVSAHQVQEFLQQKQAWIEQTRRQIRDQRAPELDARMPTTIELRAVSQAWHVSYNSGCSTRLRQKLIDSNTGHLQISFVHESDVTKPLAKWLSVTAKKILIPWLNTVSEETGLVYNKVAVRRQKTRWGSCSSRGNINLNRCLLFLEPELVRYLMVHELCHTRHMNHSRRFWSLVAKHVPNYQDCERRINNATYLIPSWVLID